MLGAIMFGFLYLSKPSEAEIAAERERSEQARAQTESKNTPTVVPFTAADSSALAGAVRAMGKTDYCAHQHEAPECIFIHFIF